MATEEFCKKKVSAMKVTVSKPLKLEKYNLDKTLFKTFMAKVVNG